MAQIAFYRAKVNEYQPRCTHLQTLLQLRDQALQAQLRDKTDFWTAENARLIAENRVLQQ